MCLRECLTCSTQAVIHPPELSKQSNSAACTFAKDSVPEQSVPPELEAMKHKGRCVNRIVLWNLCM